MFLVAGVSLKIVHTCDPACGCVEAQARGGGDVGGREGEGAAGRPVYQLRKTPAINCRRRTRRDKKLIMIILVGVLSGGEGVRDAGDTRGCSVLVLPLRGGSGVTARPGHVHSLPPGLET